jgi:hypothetical protein
MAIKIDQYTDPKQAEKILDDLLESIKLKDTDKRNLKRQIENIIRDAKKSKVFEIDLSQQLKLNSKEQR